MSRSLNQQNRTVQTQRSVSTRIRGHVCALLSLVACIAMLTAAAAPPVAAQAPTKKMEEIFKQLQKRGAGGACVGKVESAGYANVLGVIDSIGVNVRCDDGSEAGGIAPKER